MSKQTKDSMNYLKKDNTLHSKAIECITRLKDGKYRKLSDFYSAQTTKYPSVLDTDLFIKSESQIEIVENGFNPLVKRIVKINLQNKYVVDCLSSLQEAEDKRKLAEIEAQKEFERMRVDAVAFILQYPELVTQLKEKHLPNSKGLQVVAWKLSNRAHDKGFNISKTAFYHVL